MIESKSINPQSKRLTSVNNFKHIKTNKLRVKLRRRSFQVCNCSVTDAKPCSMENQCLNVLSRIECSHCPAQNKCQNRNFHLGERYSLEPRITKFKGIGLFTKEAIPENKFIIEYIGEVIGREEFLQHMNRAKSNKFEDLYFFALSQIMFIDASIYGNNARFINHSCDPNTVPQKWIVNLNGREQTCIGIFGVREIFPV